MFLKKIKIKNKLNQSKKGFIGSIGDDLPSLVPLFFALMIFFAALAFAFTTINNRNAVINTYIDSLTIAKSALSDASFSTLAEFKSTQSNIVTMSNYIYGIVYIPDDATFNFENDLQNNFENVFVQDCDDNAFKISEGKYINKLGNLQQSGSCIADLNTSYLAGSSSAMQKLTSGDSLYNEIIHRQYYYYIYPVTVLTPKGYMILYMFILVW